MVNQKAPVGRVLLGPGPSMIHPRVLAALSSPALGHLDPLLLRLYEREQELLRSTFQTANEWTFALSGTGTAGMEACIANLVEPGENVLVAVNGYFGERLAEIATRLGAQVHRLTRPPGEIFSAEEFEAALRARKYNLLALVHGETSTGAEQLHIRDVCSVAHTAGALVLVDVVTSLGGVQVDVDGWDVDAAYSASQKNLSAPAGLAPVTFGPRARRKLEMRRAAVQSFYLDLREYAAYWMDPHAYHHTASANQHFALVEALSLIMEEGLLRAWKRCRENAEMLWAGLQELGASPFIPAEYRLPPLTTARVPSGADPHQVRQRLLADFNIEIAPGFGPLRDQVWRIGLMGYSSRRENIALLLAALREILGHRAGFIA